MKVRNLIGNATICLMVLLTLCLSFQLHYTPLKKLAPSAQTDKMLRIAIITDVHVPQVDEIINRFKQVLNKKNIGYTSKFYVAKGDPVILKAMAHETFTSNYDLIWSIGTNSARRLKNLHKKYINHPPLVCSNIVDHTWYEWSKNDPEVKKCFTGSVGGMNWQRRIEMLQFFIPNLKHVLIPYSSIAGNDYKIIHDLQNCLTQKGIQSTPVHIKEYEAISKIRPFLPLINAMVLLRDVKILTMAPTLIKLANTHGIPLFACERNSIQKGAAIGIGIDETISGSITAKQALDILLNKTPVSKIPVVDLNDYGNQLMINEQTFAKQGVKLSREMLFLLKNSFVTRNTKGTL